MASFPINNHEAPSPRAQQQQQEIPHHQHQEPILKQHLSVKRLCMAATGASTFNCGEAASCVLTPSWRDDAAADVAADACDRHEDAHQDSRFYQHQHQPQDLATGWLHATSPFSCHGASAAAGAAAEISQLQQHNNKRSYEQLCSAQPREYPLQLQRQLLLQRYLQQQQRQQQQAPSASPLLAAEEQQLLVAVERAVRAHLEQATDEVARKRQRVSELEERMRRMAEELGDATQQAAASERRVALLQHALEKCLQVASNGAHEQSSYHQQHLRQQQQQQEQEANGHLSEHSQPQAAPSLHGDEGWGDSELCGGAALIMTKTPARAPEPSSTHLRSAAPATSSCSAAPLPAGPRISPHFNSANQETATAPTTGFQPFTSAGSTVLDGASALCCQACGLRSHDVTVLPCRHLTLCLQCVSRVNVCAACVVEQRFAGVAALL